MLDIINPLEIAEIVRMVGSFVEESTEVAAMLVSRTFHSQVSAFAWEVLVVNFTHKALYRDEPIYEDDGNVRSRLLPWNSLKSYGCYVHTISMKSRFFRRPPESYSTLASDTELYATLGKLPLQCMRLDISNVETTHLPQLLAICSRLTSLNIVQLNLNPEGASQMDSNWKSQESAHVKTYNLKELSISTCCGIRIAEFISRSPRLTVLSIYYDDIYDTYEVHRLEDLMECFRVKDGMPKLQHLDLCLVGVNDDLISKVLKTVRCLRSFACRRNDALLSIPDFRPHFSTLTTIDVKSGTPEFWQIVISSCPGLIKASQVVLFAEDIIGGQKWASTALESIDLNVFVRSGGDVRSSREDQEDELFRRIAKLVKLKHLVLHTGWRGRTSLRDQSWEALLRSEMLKSVELGYELTKSSDKKNISRRFLKKKIHLTWTFSSICLSSYQDPDNQLYEDILLEALSGYTAAYEN